MSEARSAIDWQEAYTRLERTRRALEGGGDRPPEETRRILQDRARALARPVEEAPAPTEVLDLLIFSLAGEHYAVETAHVVEVLPLRGLTPVPCTPPLVLGVLNHRGRILPVLDFRRLFGLAGGEVTEGSRVVAVGAGGTTFGVFAEAVAGTVRVRTQELTPPPAGLAAARQAFIRDVTGEMVAVLDLESLARDSRITVKDEGNGTTVSMRDAP